jgi:hypothetical protein
LITDVVICQHCGFGSNGSIQGRYIKCSGCGIAHTALGTDRRQEGRLKVRKECTVTHKERESPLSAMVGNVSFNGASVRYIGSAFLKDSMLYLDIEGLDLHILAKAAWTKSMSKNENGTGFRFIWSSKVTTPLCLA